MELPEQTVFIEHIKRAEYPEPPFNPPKSYPEFTSIPLQALDASNEIYDAVRRLFLALGFDREHEGTKEWNPLKDLVVPENLVVIKPNLVLHKHPLGKRGVGSMITHGSVIRPIVDYVWKALEGRGEIIICDVPLQTANWDTMMESTGLASMVTYLSNQGVNVKLLDLRLEHAILNKYGVITKRIKWNGDPRGYVAVDLGDQSALIPIAKQYQQLTITDYPQQAVATHHNLTKNEYLIAKTILAADVFINVPKLKTHKKAGVTLSMKNLIGINGDKSWIAHHREGNPKKGGDEFPYINRWDLFRYRLFVALKYRRWGIPLLSFLLRLLHNISALQQHMKGTHSRSGLLKFKSITEGSWYGNDTLWRVILDLNRILLYADKEGKLKNNIQRRYITIIDGIVGGEGNGPMHQSPKEAKVIFAGFSPLIVDTVATRFMGFNYHKIPQLRYGFKSHTYPLAPCPPRKISVVDQNRVIPFERWNPSPLLAFHPPITWRGHIELQEAAAVLTTQPYIPEFADEGGE